MDGKTDEALIEAIKVIKDIAPDIRVTIASIATLTQQMVNVESNSKKQFDMLLKMQDNEQKLRREKVKVWGAFCLALATGIINMVIAYFNMHKP